MAKFKKRLKALELRRKGKSINHITRLLEVSKGTTSIWCRNIQLTESQRDRISTNADKGRAKGRAIGTEANKRKKTEAIFSANLYAKTIIGEISSRDRLIIGVALYWAEGSKSYSTSGFKFTNSDPSMIKTIYIWLREVMKVESADIVPYLSINEIHKTRIDTVLEFWSNLLDLPLNQFGRPYFVKVKQRKVYENHNSYYGVLTIGVRRSSILKYKMLGMIECLKMPV